MVSEHTLTKAIIYSRKTDYRSRENLSIMFTFSSLSYHFFFRTDTEKQNRSLIKKPKKETTSKRKLQGPHEKVKTSHLLSPIIIFFFVLFFFLLSMHRRSANNSSLHVKIKLEKKTNKFCILVRRESGVSAEKPLEAES